jgi:hypothetical protein
VLLNTEEMERAAEEEEEACDEEADPVDTLKREKRRTKALAALIERLEAVALDAAGVAGNYGRQLLGELVCVLSCMSVLWPSVTVFVACAALSARIGGAKNPKTRLSIDLATALETLARRKAPVTPSARTPSARKFDPDERGGYTKRKGGEIADAPGSVRAKRPTLFKCVDPDCKLLDEKPISVTAQPCGLLCLPSCVCAVASGLHLVTQVTPNASGVLAGSTISSRKWTTRTRTRKATATREQQ